MWQITAAIFFIVLYAWYLWRKKHFSLLKELGIPGPEPNIFFGNLFDMGKTNPVECQNEWLKKYGRVTGYYFGATPMVLIADPDILKSVQISDFHNFIDRPRMLVGGNDKPTRRDFISLQMISLRDKRWKEIRSIVTPSFTASKMKLMAPSMNSAIDTLIELIDEKAKLKKSFDIYVMLQGLSLDVIGRAAFGVQTDCQRNPDSLVVRSAKAIFSGNLASVLNLFWLSFPELKIFDYLYRFRMTLRNRGTNPIKMVSDTTREIIRSRRENKANSRQDLLQLMIDARALKSDIHNVKHEDLIAEDDFHHENENNESVTPNGFHTNGADLHRYMDEEEILANAFLFFLAGYETTSTTMAFVAHFLVHYPEMQEKIRNEVKSVCSSQDSVDYACTKKLQFFDQFVKECLRMYPPIPFFTSREVRENIDYGNLRLRKGCCVQVPVTYLHHDRELWKDPEKFDPERFSPENKAKIHPMAYQPFGAGPRNCVGMRFALMEIKTTFARLLLKYRLEACEETEKVDLALRVSPFTISPAKGIHLKAVPL